MAKESIIRVHRTSTASSVPSLTAGELGVNLSDRRFFVGGADGNNIVFYDNRGMVYSVNGATGAISITGDGGAMTIGVAGTANTVKVAIAPGCRRQARAARMPESSPEERKQATGTSPTR